MRFPLKGSTNIGHNHFSLDSKCVLQIIHIQPTIIEYYLFQTGDFKALSKLNSLDEHTVSNKPSSVSLSNQIKLRHDSSKI
jgi:hypothetical protein